jgi:hypothetical protein
MACPSLLSAEEDEGNPGVKDEMKNSEASSVSSRRG